jgi:hypothetical protein
MNEVAIVPPDSYVAVDLQPPPFPDGVYFGLPADLYHRDLAIGSTDIKALADEPEAYWYNSPLNPLREDDDDKETPSKILGTAAHTLLLDGLDVFLKRYVRRPPEIKTLTERLRAEIAPNGEEVLPTKGYDRIIHLAKAVTDHKHLAAAFQGGMPEVSIFWTEDFEGVEIRRKARIDFLKPMGVNDLKTISPQGRGPLAIECGRAIANYKYDVQVVAYLQARAQVPRLIREGKVYGLPPERSVFHNPNHRAYLDKLRDAPGWAFVFVFITTTGPARVWGCSYRLNNPLLAQAESVVTKALWNYAYAVKTWGYEKPWVHDADELTEVTADLMPRWHGYGP